MRRRPLLLTAFALGLLLATVPLLGAQAGPFSAQIQAALRNFAATAQTWTGTQTFTEIVLTGTNPTTFTHEALSGNFPTTSEPEMILINSLAGSGTLALKNNSASGYSAITFRDANAKELLAIGHGGASVGPALLQDANFIESWSGVSTAAAPKVLRIMMDGDYGATGSGYRFYQRQSFETDGGVKWWQLIPSGTTQVETMALGANGGLAIGLAAVDSFTIHTQTQNSLQAGLRGDQYSDSTSGMGLVARKARGTPASPAGAASGDAIWQLVGYAMQSDLAWSSTPILAINGVTTEAQTSTAHGSRWDVRVTPPTTTTLTTVAQFTPAGIQTAGSTPSVANVGANSCGTTAATIAGNANSGRITVGATSGTQCRVTVPAATTQWNGACSNTTTANLCRLVGQSTTTFDVIGTFVAGDVIAYVAFPR